MTVTRTTNLFPYLVAEEQHRDNQAEEALFLTFNVDLGYFEARLLGLLRATGARVTVIADAGVWAPDPRSVKHAGRSYQLGLVDQPTAFHPKLMVLVGPKRAIAAVGSGNLTMGGWQYNRELLTVFTGDGGGMPAAFGDIRDALMAFGAGGILDSVTAQGVARTIRHLDTLLESAPTLNTGHRVHASWIGPLIDHLPAEPVVDLYLSAAFHDPNAHAVRSLLTRLQPRRVHVAVQPGWTHLDATALSQVLSTYAREASADTALLQDPESPGTKKARYRHGKLIEWVTVDGDRHAMTGSPNLSTVALLRRGGDGGNHELAVTGPVDATLFPGGQPIDPASVPRLVGAEEDEASLAAAPALVRVLSAVTKDDRLTVTLSRAADELVTVEASHRNDHPDHWTALGTAPAGVVAVHFDAALPGGSRVRAVTDAGGPTAPMFVTDELRVLVRSIPERHASKTHSSNANDLFGQDLDLLNLLQGELTAYAQDVSNARRPTAARDGDGERADVERGRDADPMEPWLWLQEDTVRRYGPGIASWLLALPRLTDTESTAVPWIDIITDEQAVGLDSDEEATDVDEKLTAGEVDANTRDLIDHTTDAERLKTARRRWAAKATAVAPSLSVPSRLLILRITLAFWTAGNWTDGDPEPFTLTRNLVRTLTFVDEAPVEIAQRAASLAAIALTVMRQHTDVTVGTEQTLRYRETREAASPLLQYAAEDTVESYVAGLRTVNGGTLTSGHVTDTLDDLSGDDPLAELEAAMETKGFEVHRPSPKSMHIHKTGGNAELSALEAVGFAQDHDGIVVWATTDQGRWACVAWRAPDLVSVFNVGAQERWRHQRLQSAGPAAAANALSNAIRSNEGTSGLPGVINKPKHRKTADAEAVLAALGIGSPPESPPCCTENKAD
ncbi:hypothetical protein [Nocardioides sp. KR10-350]|uniref:hypothetical protein n=1 Tax=Nocardioides cheoyonin TaxID=3156615 RepID=UPI0032B400CB